MEKQRVKGLSYLCSFISKEGEKELMEYIAEQEWNTSLKRRTQHYGYTYAYDRKNTLQVAQPIPPLFEFVKKQIEAYVGQSHQEKYEFDQVIINEYQPGQGISPHIDNPKLFDCIVASLSLGSDCVMMFEDQSGLKVEQLLERRSLLVLTQESRYKWKHSIPNRKSDHGVPRKLRYSLTFRKVKHPHQNS